MQQQKQGIAPEAARQYARWQFDSGNNRGVTTDRSLDLCWPAMAKLQAANVPIA